MAILAFALIPVFFELLLGYFAGIRTFVDNRDVRSLVGLVTVFGARISGPVSLCLVGGAKNVPFERGGKARRQP